MKKKKEKIIKKITEELLKKMMFSKAVVEIKKQENSDGFLVSIQVDNPSRLIGQSGSNLNDFQKILRLLILKKDSDISPILVDINNYRIKREDFLKELANEIAEQVIKTQKSVMLQPMSSYERRIVHLELAKNSDITTESVGEGADRRLVIKPNL